MQKLLVLVLILGNLIACTNGGSGQKNANTTNSIDTLQTTGPDAADLVRALQGKWQNEQDPTQTVEIVDTKIRHFNQDRMISEMDIDVDSQCQSSPCKTDTTALSDGWCFVEKSKSEQHCILVVYCDKEQLKFTQMGTASGLLSFKKMN